MLPVFKDYYNFLIDSGIDKIKDYDIGKIWIDNQIIKGFDKTTGQEVKIIRLKIADDLTISYSEYKDKIDNNNLETFEETYARHESQILSKEEQSKQESFKIIKKYPNHKIVLTTSMGKDSILTEYLFDKWDIKFDEKIFNNTTMDCGDVYKMVKSRKDVKIVTPKDNDGNNRSYFRLSKQSGFASRQARWCCDIFKEGATTQYLQNYDNILFVMGMRNDESNTRSEYEFERRMPKWKNNTWVAVLPILKWTELELWLYTIHNNIEINPKYLKGYSRCGCHVVCPFYTKSTWVLDKYWYPEQFNRFHNLLEVDFEKNEKWTRLNCTKQEYHICWNGGIYRDAPTEDVIKEFSEHKNIPFDVAEKFFNKTCSKCNNTKGKPTAITKKDEVAMNLKLIGRNTETYLCKKCLMKEFNITKEQWVEMVKRFKSQGCDLF